MRAARSTTALINLATLMLVVVALYFAKPVLMPVALATLLTFLLSPVVSNLCRSGLRQSIAVAFVVILVFSILGTMIWAFGMQLTSLVAQLPNYKQNVREKIVELRSAGSGSPWERVHQTWRELRGEIKKIEQDNQTRKAAADAATDTTESSNAETSTNAAPPEIDPVPVVVRGQSSDSLWALPTALGPLAELGATAGLVVVLVIFMLLRGRELRNRLIVLFGQNHIPTTTRALDEAAARISRYLLMQTMINSTYGLAVGIALYLIGLPYSFTWGFLAALLRFIPYVGPSLGAAMPILLSLAVFPGWFYPLMVLGVILIFELISNMFMEPMLYGGTVGVSEVALIIAVAFWTWIWGPIGLALATPLTVCLVVLGKHVPSLSFLPLLLGDEPVMTLPVQFYQRLLAMDAAEAREIALTFRSKSDLIDLFDQLLVPALTSARRDHKDAELSAKHLEFITEHMEKLIVQMSPDRAEDRSTTPVSILGVPVEDKVDELVLDMLNRTLPGSFRIRAVSSQALSGELIEEIDHNPPTLVCIGTAVPGGLGEMRYLAKRVRAKLPGVPVLLGLWGLNDARRGQDLARKSGATAIATTLKEARNLLMQFAQLAPAAPWPPLDHEIAQPVSPAFARPSAYP